MPSECAISSRASETTDLSDSFVAIAQHLLDCHILRGFQSASHSFPVSPPLMVFVKQIYDGGGTYEMSITVVDNNRL